MTSISKGRNFPFYFGIDPNIVHYFGPSSLTLGIAALVAISTASAEAPSIHGVPIRELTAPILVTEGKLTEQVRDLFWRGVGGYRARIVVLAPKDYTEAAAQFPWQIRGSKQTTVLHWPGNSPEESLENRQKVLSNASGVWVEELPTEMSIEELRLLREELEVARREGYALLGGRAGDVQRIGLSDWPLQFIRGGKELPDSEGLQVVLLARDALAMERRLCRNLGSRPVEIEYPAVGEIPATTFTLRSGHQHDLVALQRAAFFRWPTDAKQKIEVGLPRGSLVIVGGGGTPKGLMEKFVELAGGPDATIVVLPTAEEIVPRSEQVGEVRMLERAGAKKIVVLPQIQKDAVESEEFRDALNKAGGVWFGGGRQWRFVDAYAGTQAVALFHEVLARGGVIGGSSAGASIQGDFLCRGNPLGNLDIDSFGYQQGFAFLRGTAIDQHFTQRNRLPELTQLIRDRPQFLGIGLDESTAIVVQESRADVFGAGDAFFVDGSITADEPPVIHKLKAGESFDFVKRQPSKAD